jgi:hypothetical protein
VVQRWEVVEVVEMEIEAPQFGAGKHLNELCAVLGTTGEMEIAEDGEGDWSDM